MISPPDPSSTVQASPPSPSVPTESGSAERGAAPRRGSRRALLIILPVLLVFAGIPVFRILTDQGPEAPVVIPPPVVTTTAVVGVAEATLEYPGTLLADSTVSVVPRVGGRIVDVPIAENDVVGRDQIVARIDDEALRLQASQAESAWQAAEAQWRQTQAGARTTELAIAAASVEQAEESLETARSNLERTERLYEAGTVARSDFEEALDRFNTAATEVDNARRRLDLLDQGATDDQRSAARSQADAARRQFELAELQLSHAIVRSPVAGRVVRLFVGEGDTVGLSSPIAAVVSDAIIRAEINVPERHYGRFFGREDAVSVRVRPTAWDELFSGRVTRVSTVVDAASRTFTVEATIDNADGRLRPGMYVVTEFVVDRVSDATLVPSSAVVRRGARDVVYVIDERPGIDGVVTTVREMPVEPVRLADDLTWVSNGVVPGDVIVAEGNAFLEDGRTVRVIGERQP